MEHFDCDTVTERCDLYAAATYDHEFFLARVASAPRVLELMSCMGRLSIPLIRAGAVLTWELEKPATGPVVSAS